ncbi:MAG: hypothetical protein ACOH1Y_16900 [Propionicimonas sp.]
MFNDAADPPKAARSRDNLIATAFTRLGWTAAEWEDLYNQGTPASISQHYLQEWLVSPPERFAASISPDLVRETFALYGSLAQHVLNAYAAGASARFVNTYAGQHEWLGHTIKDTWADLADLGLSEAACTGWAHIGGHRWPTGGHDASLGAGNDSLVARWVNQFGPASYLWVLAGYTLDEATNMRDSGTVVSEKQLRVMVALAGVVLPDGI